MTLSTHSPQLTDSIPHDERFFQQVLEGWQGDLAHFVQYGVPRLLVALVLSFIFVRIILFFVKRMHLRADGMVGNSQRAAQLRTMAAILRATTYGVTGFYLITQILGGHRRLAGTLYRLCRSHRTGYQLRRAVHLQGHAHRHLHPD